MTGPGVNEKGFRRAMAALVEPRIFQKLSVDEDDARRGGFGCCSYGGARLVLHVMDHSSKTLAAYVLSREGDAKHYVTTITPILVKVGDAIRAFSRAQLVLVSAKNHVLLCHGPRGSHAPAPAGCGCSRQ